jgi:DeoR family transcriptional regulator, fructose operon transcriptional repressor
MAMSPGGSRLRYESAPARRQRILDVLKETGFSNVSVFATMLNVSEMTVRRDFRHLADLGLIRQVHGGVSAVNAVDGPIDFRLRAAENQEAKRAIALKAVTYLSGSSTRADCPSVAIGKLLSF